MWGGGGTAVAMQVKSQSNVQKNSRTLVKGMGGLKFENKVHT